MLHKGIFSERGLVWNYNRARWYDINLIFLFQPVTLSMDDVNLSNLITKIILSAMHWHISHFKKKCRSHSNSGITSAPKNALLNYQLNNCTVVFYNCGWLDKA